MWFIKVIRDTDSVRKILVYEKKNNTNALKYTVSFKY